MRSEILFLIIFILGELLFNLTWFRYLKNYFKFQESNVETEEPKTNNKPKIFLFAPLSIVKGIMERFIITSGLILGFEPILVVFGTIKLGTRFKDNQEIKNDYFLLGNFSSILISILYFYLLRELL